MQIISPQTRKSDIEQLKQRIDQICDNKKNDSIVAIAAIIAETIMRITIIGIASYFTYKMIRGSAGIFVAIVVALVCVVIAYKLPLFADMTPLIIVHNARAIHIAMSGAYSAMLKAEEIIEIKDQAKDTSISVIDGKALLSMSGRSYDISTKFLNIRQMDGDTVLDFRQLDDAVMTLKEAINIISS